MIKFKFNGCRSAGTYRKTRPRRRTVPGPLPWNLHLETFVYLLVLEKKLRFKIGKARDIRARSRSIGHCFDPSRSIGLLVDSTKAAYDLESILHKSFKRWRIDPSVVLEEDGYRSSGFTEWFSLDGWDRIRKFLDENAELLGFALVAPLTELFAAPVAVNLKAGSGPRRRRHADPVADRVTFDECAATCYPLLDELVSLCDTCEVVQLHHSAAMVGSAAHTDRVEFLLSEIVCEGQYDVGWGAGRVFPSCEVFTGAHVTFTVACEFYWKAFGDKRFIPLQDAFLALPLGIKGWKEFADVDVSARAPFVIPRSGPEQWILPPF
jgi:hypothetical protein